MTKIRRNAPCPCGSGQKYKKCCWSRHRAATPAAAHDSSPALPVVVWNEDDNLDELSNSVVDLLAEGKIDAAESAAKELLERYPEVVDGLERMAMVAEARAQHTRAAQYYRQAADFTRTHPGYDPETTAYYTDNSRRLESHTPSESDPDH
jgi:tetratricopeptide (TPR) repeat protein